MNVITVTHDVEKVTGCALYTQQFKAMFYKRVIYTWRNKILTFSQIILPSFFTALTILIMKTGSSDDGVADKRALNLDMFASTKVIILNGYF